MATHTFRRWSSRLILAGSAWLTATCGLLRAEGNTSEAPSIIHHVRAGDKLEMVVNTSRILTLDQKIPQAQVNNRDVLDITPLAPNQIQVSAKKAGVTQVNLWDDKKQIHTIDVTVIGDARELAALLNSEFPKAAIKVRPIASGALVSGYVDRPEDVDRIKQIAEEYYPKVILNVTVGGVQQVILNVKVMEVSRTKLRTLSFDFSQISSGNLNTLVRSGISGLIGGLNNQGQLPLSPNTTFQFGVVSGSSTFQGVLEALCQSDVAKVLSEPKLLASSGRPAFFMVGGEIPYAVSQGLGAVSIEWKNYGTRVDFVPIVLGNGKIRLEVRPEVSEVDTTRSSVQGVPAIKKRWVDTGVELAAGQTFAIAGLVQTRLEARKRGVPWVSDVPYLGVLFRKVSEEKNEVETLILVTPELADPMDPEEVPPCGPGARTASPNDWELFMRGYIEVPNPCPPCQGDTCPNHGSAPGQQPGGNSPAEAGGAPGAAAAPGQSAYSSRPGASPYKRRSNTVARSSTTGNPYNPNARAGSPSSAANAAGLPGFNGPIGYDLTE